MQIIEKIKVKHLGEPFEATTQRRIPITDYPLFSKMDNASSVVIYVRMMEEEGHDMSNFDYTKLPAEKVDCDVRKGNKR